MKKENIVIIGMGFLATYAIPCYERLLGDEISKYLVGIKGSDCGLKERQAQCNFPVQVGRVRETLEEKRPGLIILAVKPNQIADMVEGTLVPYYQMLREKGEELPDLYSFAPAPPVSYYYDTLWHNRHLLSVHFSESVLMILPWRFFPAVWTVSMMRIQGNLCIWCWMPGMMVFIAFLRRLIFPTKRQIG